MNILIVDTETTGLSPEKCNTIELAAILYNVEHKQMLQCFSTLLPCEINPVEHINGIPAALTQQLYSPSGFIQMFESLSSFSDAIIAHNASFDKGFIDKLMMWSIPQSNFYNKTPWICTVKDFTWPTRPAKLKLQNVCESFGIPYVGAHRALTDCQLLAQCLGHCSELESLIIQTGKLQNVA